MSEQGNLSHIAAPQVVEGEAASSKVGHWISKHYGGKMHIEVKSVAEDSGSTAAVAQLQADIKAPTFIIMSGDLVTDVPLKVCITELPLLTPVQQISMPHAVYLLTCQDFVRTVQYGPWADHTGAGWLALQALAASHYVTEATVTVLLKERRVSPASETKPGKAPKNVDYIGALTKPHGHPSLHKFSTLQFAQ